MLHATGRQLRISIAFMSRFRAWTALKPAIGRILCNVPGT